MASSSCPAAYFLSSSSSSSSLWGEQFAAGGVSSRSGAVLSRCNFASVRGALRSQPRNAPPRAPSERRDRPPRRFSAVESQNPPRVPSERRDRPPRRSSAVESQNPPRVPSERRDRPPRRSSAVESQNPPRRSSSSQPKKHWREGEFPGVSEGARERSRGGPIKNVKKKVEDKENAKAWVATVTESLAERMQKKDWEGALEAFEMLKEQPFYTPKEGTYMKLLVLLGRSGQPAVAQKLFDEMQSEGIEPTSELYTALLSSYSRSHLLDEAFSILSTMKSSSPRCHPDVFTYSTLLKACSECSRFDLVKTLTEDMADRGIPANTVTQNAILSGFGKAGQFEDVERVLSSMLDSASGSGPGAPDVWTMNIILSLFSNKIELMERWYEKFRAFGIEPETRTFNLLIGAYAKLGLFDKMAAVLEHMRRASFPWTTATYNNVIEALGRAGQAKEMEWAWDQMRAERMKPDTKTFCGLIEGYSKAGLFHKVVDAVQMAGKAEVTTTTAFFNAVIAACARAGDLVEMERVYQRMKDAKRRPDDETYSILTEAYANKGMTDRIYELEQERARADVEMKSGGFEP